MSPTPRTHIALLTLIATALLFSCDSSDAEQAQARALATGAERHYTFEGFMDGFYGVGGAIDGIKNPTIEVQAGDEVTFHLINGEDMAHDIALKSHGLRSEMLIRTGEETTLTFIALRDDQYYCTVPGHVQTGMIGDLRVLPPPDDPGGDP